MYVLPMRTRTRTLTKTTSYSADTGCLGATMRTQFEKSYRLMPRIAVRYGFNRSVGKSLRSLLLVVPARHGIVERPPTFLQNRYPLFIRRGFPSQQLNPGSDFGTLAFSNPNLASNVAEGTIRSDAANAVCLVLDDRGWCADIEEKLATIVHKITPDLVLQVVRFLKDPALALNFMRWAIARKGYEPTAETFAHIIARFGRKRNFTDAWRLLDEMSKHQLKVDYAFSIFIQRLKRAKKAQGLVKAMCGMKFLKVTPSIPLYTAVIEFLLKKGLGEDAEYLYNQMLQDGLVPDQKLFEILVKGFSKLGKFDETFLFLKGMKNQGYVPHVSVYTTVICQMSLAGKLEAGHQIYLEMVQNGRLPKVFGNSEVACALHGNNTMKQIEEFQQIVWDMPSKLRVHSFNSLLQFLLGAGMYEEARKVYHRLEWVYLDSVNVPESAEKIPIWNMESYKIYIVGMCKLGCVHHALETFSDLVSSGNRPTSEISSSLLCTLSGANMVDEAVDLCRHIIKYRDSINIDAQKSFLTMLRTSHHLNIACKVFLSLRKNGCIDADSDFVSLVGYDNKDDLYSVSI